MPPAGKMSPIGIFRFAADLRSLSKSPVAYAEIAGAQHAFEIFPSLRGELVLAGVERFLALLYGRHVARREERASVSVAS